MTTQNANPFITIIIPSLNEEKFLPRLLKNLAEQTTSNFEVVHVDGQSEDATRHLALGYADKIPGFKQIISPIRHVSHQRNLGVASAAGEYLLFIDADTQLPAYFIEGLSYQLHKAPAEMFTTWAIPDSTKGGDKTLITIINLGLEVSQLVESPFAIGVLMGCSRKAFSKIGGFDEKIHYGEDEDFIKTGYRKRLSFKVYKEPRFVYSLRRFRKEGTLPTLQQMAAKKLKIITSKEYPMGGHNFLQDDSSSTIFKQVDDAIRKFNAKTLPSGKPTKLKTFLKNLLTFEEID